MICFQPPGFLWNPENNPENPQPSKLLSVVSAVSFLTELTPCVAVQTGQLDDETWQSPHVSSNESFAQDHFDLQKKVPAYMFDCCWNVWSSLGTIFWTHPTERGCVGTFLRDWTPPFALFDPWSEFDHTCWEKKITVQLNISHCIKYLKILNSWQWLQTNCSCRSSSDWNPKNDGPLVEWSDLEPFARLATFPALRIPSPAHTDEYTHQPLSQPLVAELWSCLPPWHFWKCGEKNKSIKSSSSWWFQPIPQIGVKIKNIWNHHHLGSG